MKRHQLSVLALGIALFALVIGCASTAGGFSGAGRRGSGTLNGSYNEQISLTTGNVWSSARYVGTMDNVSWDLSATSGTAACTVAVQISNRFDPTTSSTSDDTLWTIYAPSGWVPPGNISGPVTSYYVEAIPLSGRYERLKFVCSSGSTQLTVATQLKGG